MSIVSHISYGIDYDSNKDLFDNSKIFKVITSGFEIITGVSEVRAVEVIQHMASKSNVSMNELCNFNEIEYMFLEIAKTIDWASPIGRGDSCAGSVIHFLEHEGVIDLPSDSFNLIQIEDKLNPLKFKHIIIGLKHEVKLSSTPEELDKLFEVMHERLDVLLKDSVTPETLKDRAKLQSMVIELDSYGRAMNHKHQIL